MGIPPVRSRRTAPAGFTLLELVLVVALVLLLAGAAVLNLDSLRHGAALDEGVGQLESLFRYARAQAESSGRQVRVVFGPWVDPAAGATSAGIPDGSPTPPGSPGETAGITTPPPVQAPADGAVPELHLLWEPDPVRAPGRFVTLPGAAGFTGRLNEQVRFRRALDPLASLTATSATWGGEGAGVGMNGTAGMDGWGGTNAPVAGVRASAETDPAALPPIAFFPDGSSANAELEVFSAEPTDTRVFRVSLAGITGTFRRRLVPPPGTTWGPEETVPAGPAQDTATAGVPSNP